MILLGGASGGKGYAHGAYHDLVRGLEDDIARTPDNFEYRLRLAEAHVDHGEWEASLHEIDKIRRLAGGRYETRLFSGKALAAAGLLEESLRELNGFLESNPGDQSALVERARVGLRLGRNEEGCADYLAAIASPAKVEIYVEASEALRRLGRLVEALRCAEAGEDIGEGDPSALLCVLECAKELGRVETVVGTLDRLRRVWPRPEIWMQQKAEYLAEKGRAQESRAAWSELYDHLMLLPNLERAQPSLAGSLEDCRRALSLPVPTPVIAPPAAVE
jgi:tetratricopeptide (TPR) repeat protein